jgi:hypothetical protein
LNTANDAAAAVLNAVFFIKKPPNTATDAAVAVLNAVFSFKNSPKYGNRYGSSRIECRIFIQKQPKIWQLMR